MRGCVNNHVCDYHFPELGSSLTVLTIDHLRRFTNIKNIKSPTLGIHWNINHFQAWAWRCGHSEASVTAMT